jgi:hypothetical protein
MPYFTRHMNKPQEGALETYGAVIALIVVFFAYLVP